MEPMVTQAKWLGEKNQTQTTEKTFWSGTDKIPGFLTKQLLRYQPGTSIIMTYSTQSRIVCSTIFIFIV